MAEKKGSFILDSETWLARLSQITRCMHRLLKEESIMETYKWQTAWHRKSLSLLVSFLSGVAIRKWNRA